VGFRISARIVYWFERASEIIAATLFTTLVVSLLVRAEQRFAVQQPLDTIEAQFAMSWSIDQALPDVLPQRMNVVTAGRRISSR
jgi:hypothetical protein